MTGDNGRRRHVEDTQNGHPSFQPRAAGSTEGNHDLFCGGLLGWICRQVWRCPPNVFADDTLETIKTSGVPSATMQSHDHDPRPRGAVLRPLTVIRQKLCFVVTIFEVKSSTHTHAVLATDQRTRWYITNRIVFGFRKASRPGMMAFQNREGSVILEVPTTLNRKTHAMNS